MKKFLLFCFILLAFTLQINAQGSGLSLGNDAYSILERMEIKMGIPSPIHSSNKYFDRKDAAYYALMMDTVSGRFSGVDRLNLYYIYKDNNEFLITDFSNSSLEIQEPIYEKVYIDSTETFYRLKSNAASASTSTESDQYILSKKPFLKYFYKTPANFFEVDRENFYLKANPLIYFQMGQDDSQDGVIFQNTRGLRIRGGVDDRLYFSTSIFETQARFPGYVTDRINRFKAVPGAGFYKSYNSSVFEITDGFDYLNAEGFIGVNATKHVGVQLGHGRHFIGDGHRSLFLSDYANNYFYLKLNIRVWKLHLQNIFAELAAQGARDDRGDQLIPKKYFAAHHLTYRPIPNLSFGIFETVVFSRRDHFEFQYLNPIILYRTVEQAVGSADNVLLGFDAKWNFLNRFQLYSQFIFDEFKFDELVLDQQGWWANKFAFQAGLKYINVAGINNLDAQVEYNLVRPYTYTHRDTTSHYSHYNQPLAHPLGANLSEFIFKLRYQPKYKWVINAKIIQTNYGEDEVDNFWGNNILIPSTERVQDYGNEIGQGIKTNLLMANLKVSYQFKHNLFFDVFYTLRNYDSEVDALDGTSNIFGGAVRLNFWEPAYEF